MDDTHTTVILNKIKRINVHAQWPLYHCTEYSTISLLLVSCTVQTSHKFPPKTHARARASNLICIPLPSPSIHPTGPNPPNTTLNPHQKRHINTIRFNEFTEERRQHDASPEPKKGPSRSKSPNRIESSPLNPITAASDPSALPARPAQLQLFLSSQGVADRCQVSVKERRWPVSWAEGGRLQS